VSLSLFSFALVYVFLCKVLTKDLTARSTLFSGALGNSYCNLWLEITFSPAKVYGSFPNFVFAIFVPF